MLIPEFLYIGSAQIYTSLFFVIAGVIIALYIFWLEGTKDGFDFERLFDLFFMSLLFGVGFSYAVIKYLATRIYLTGTDYFFVTSYLCFIVSYLNINYFTKKWAWSVFRISDLFSFAYLAVLAMLNLSQFLIYGSTQHALYALLLMVLLVVSILVRSKISSGIIFSTILILYSIFAGVFFHSLDNLIFYLVLITISVSTFLKRKKTGKLYAQFTIRSKLHK